MLKRITISFKNKKGEIKTVAYYIEKSTYENIIASNLSDEEKLNILVNEYREYEKERYVQRRKRKIQNQYTLYSLNNFSLSPHEVYEVNESKKRIINSIQKLDKIERKIIYFIFYKNKTQKYVAKKLGMSKSNVCKKLKVIYEKLKIFLKN